MIAISVPGISLGIAFTIARVSPWYMSIFLSPLMVVVMHNVHNAYPSQFCGPASIRCASLFH